MSARAALAPVGQDWAVTDSALPDAPVEPATAAPEPDRLLQVEPEEVRTEPEGEAMAPASPEPLNGLGVPDWLVEPLLVAAVAGLEAMSRSDLPPRLAPLAGRRHKKMTRANRDLLISSLGRHHKFTQAVYDVLYEERGDEAKALREMDSSKVMAALEEGSLDPPVTVSLLFAEDREEDARRAAAWATEKGEASDTLTGIIDVLTREAREARGRLERLDHELAQERRARRGLERRLDRAEDEAATARTKATTAEAQAAWSRVERDAEAAHSTEVVRHVQELEAAAEEGRRERRDLLAELRDLQQRYQRARRELREVRAQLPPPEVDEGRPRLELRTEESAPTTAELRDRFVDAGAKAVVESRRILVIVDGWNISLAHVPAGRLEDKRRVLEQGLERYRARTGNAVMVVYDGKKVDWFWMPRAAGLGIGRVFTEDQTADDYIVGELEAGFDSNEAPVVVTSDKELRRRCIAEGAFVVSSEDFAKVVKL